MSRTLASPGSIPSAPVEISGLDPRVTQLALASGLFVPRAGAPGTFDLNPDWFTNPIEHTATALKTNGAQLAELLGQLLGSVGGTALGIPLQDPGDLGTWYPILNPDTKAPTGLYLTSKTSASKTVFGIGANHSWDLTTGLAVRAWGLAPIAAVGDGGFELALGQAGYPLNAGLEVVGPSALIDQYGFSLQGMRLSANLGLLPEPGCDLSLVVVQLKLPGETHPSDRSLADLEQLTGEQILSTVSTLFLAALADAAGQLNDPRISCVLPVLGFSSDVPASLAAGFPEVSLPVLRWDHLAASCASGDVTRPFKDWFNALLASPDTARAWLACIQGLEGIHTPAVIGSGTREDPYRVALLTTAAGELSFTIATSVDALGRRAFYPGLRFTGSKIAIGTAPAAVQVAADLELAQFQLSSDGVSADPTSLRFDAGINLVGAGQTDGRDDPLFNGQVGGQSYQFGSVSAGLAIGDAGGTLQVIPAFTLNGVVTPNGTYQSLDLTQPGDVVQKAEQELLGLVNAALLRLFGLGPGSENTPGHAIAALLGVIAPSTGDPSIEWPPSLMPPLTASQLPASLHDPAGALGTYYSTLLSQGTLVGGRIPFYYLVREAAVLFQTTGVTSLPALGSPGAGWSPAISGSGTADDPWLAPLTTAGSMVAALEAYAQPLTAPSTGRRLVFGFVLSPRLQATPEVSIDIDCSLRVLSLDLTTSGVAAQILPGLGVAVTLPQGVTTPPVAGASVTVARSGLVMGWSPHDGWQWSMHVAQPVLTVGGTELPIGADMDYRQGDSLEALVLQQAKTFAGILPRILGIAAMRADDRAGLVFNGVFGLLPNLAGAMPAGVAWPDDMPMLSLDSFDDPMGALRTQINGLFGTPERLRAALQLVAWSSSGGGNIPAIAGSGTFDDPFHLPLGLASDIGLAVSSDPTAGTVSVGLDRSIRSPLSASLVATTRVTARLVTGSLTRAALTGVPGARLTCTFSNPMGQLVPATAGISLDTLSIGVDVSAGGTVAQPQVAVEPLFELSNLVLPELPVIPSVNVARPGSVSPALLEKALSIALQTVLPTALVSEVATKAYGLLAQMGLVLPAPLPAALPLGINPAGWRALLADPLSFTRERLVAIASRDQTRADLFDLLQVSTGVTLPTVPTSVKEALSAFGLLNGVDAGYAPVLPAFVQLFSHPVVYSSSRFGALVADRTRLQALLSKLTQVVDPQPVGPFLLQVLAGPVLRLSIPPGRVKAGALLECSGGASLDLSAGTERLAIDARLYNPQTQLAVTVSVSVHAGGDPACAMSLAFGDGSVPVADPLQFYPFDTATFVPALARIAPAYSLSVLVSEVIDPKLLQPYPLVQGVFSVLGIAAKDDAGTWRTRSLLGLFDDPAGWLLSGAVLGDHGRLNIARLQTLLAQLPDVSQPSLGLSVSKITNGIRVSGLPYGLRFDLSADPAANRVRFEPALGSPLTVASGRATLEELDFGLTLGPDFQPGLGGAIAIAAKVPGVAATVSAKAGYDHGFFLAAGEEAAPGVGPSTPLGAGPAATDAASLQLVPFPGWQSLVQAAGQVAVQQLLPDLASKLVQGLRDHGAQPFADALSTAATNLDIKTLVASLLAATPDATKLEDAALAWLCGRLASANASHTAQVIVDLLHPIGVNVTAQGGLIAYRPSADVPITLLLGANSTNLVGLWAGVRLPATSVLQVSIEQTGVGMPFDPATGALTGTTPQFQTGLSLSIPIEREVCAPQFHLAYDNDQHTFVAGFDPMGRPGEPSDLYRELLPQFFGQPADVGDALEQWLVAVLKEAAPRYLSVVLLNQAIVKSWLDTTLLGSTPGTVLASAHLLTHTGGAYGLETFDNLRKLTIEDFVAGLLKALLGTQVTVLTFGTNGDKGSLVVGPSASGASDYGVRLIATGLALPSSPNFVFQLGAEDTGWIAEAGGSSDLQRGLGIFVPIDSAPHFDRLKLQLVNVGMDFVGRNRLPLVELSRFSLGGISPRGVLSFDFADGVAPREWGAEVTFDRIGVSLSPAAITENANPVAQNLLGSSSTGASAPNGGARPANPAFSARAGYLWNDKGTLYVQLFQDDNTSASKVWFPVQRSFGPLHVNMIGVEWERQTSQAGVLFDGSVSLAGLFVGLQQLAVSFDVTHPTDYDRYQLDLAGLDIQFENGSVELSGAFFKQDSPLRYDGAATLRMGTFGLDALGSYALVPVSATSDEKAASLFIFVNLNVPLGGPPAFFVMGLAAGFGYNRDILIPQPGDIGGFPMVAGATNPDFFARNADGKADPTSALAKLSDVVPPQIGSYWVAAGVKFSSFELINSFVLLFVKFGNQFEIDLIGVASASLPPNSPQTIAYVELGLVASFKPAEGTISVRAQLTPNSYLLARSCKLTGGFALVIWFSGDFVISLGGYHPAYARPANYPDVPRLGFVWPVSVDVGRLTIAGGAYFALTPTAVMAGGYLQVAFVMGPIRAWLDAGADFLIQWKPFYYDINVHVSVGVEFHTEIAGVSITLSASLGAALHIWGPETAGVAEINWYAISFTIPIGNQQRSHETQPLKDWNEFAASFLPPATSTGPRSMALAAGAAPGVVLKSSAVGGLLKEDGPHGWLVNPSAWQLRIDTAVPASVLTVTHARQTFPAGVPMGVRPMNVPAVDTPLLVTVEGFDATTSAWTAVELAARNIDATSTFIDAASALWSKSALNLDAPPTGPTTVKNVYAGVLITGIDTTLADPIGPIDLKAAFEFVSVGTLYYPRPPAWPAPAALTQSNAFARLTGTIMAPPVVAMRRAVLEALRDHDVAALPDPQLAVIAAHAQDLYQAPPVLAEIGAVALAAAPARPAQPPARVAATAPVALRLRPAAVRLETAASRYVAATTAAAQPAATEAAPLLLRSARTHGKSVDEPRPGAEPRGLRAFATPAAPADGQVRFQVLEGGSAVCGVDPGDRGSLAAVVQGSLPVRLIELNAHDEVIGDQVHGAGSTVQLRDGAASVAFHGLSAQAPAPAQVVGWQSNTLLMQIGRYTFVADGCRVRPQASPVRRLRGRHVRRGLIEGAQVVAQNRVQGRGRLHAGWVETVLPGSSSAVAVILGGGSAKDASTVAVKFADVPLTGEPRFDAAATHAAVMTAQDGFILYFDVPPELASAESLAVLVQTGDSLRLRGVWGAATDAQSMMTGWRDLSGHTSGVLVGGGSPAFADVRVMVRQGGRS